MTTTMIQNIHKAEISISRGGCPEMAQSCLLRAVVKMQGRARGKTGDGWPKVIGGAA